MSDLFRIAPISFCLFLAACDQTQTETQVEAQSETQIQEATRIQLAEIKLIDPQDDERGYCVDLFAHLTGAYPIAGLQGHNCFLYFGEGPTVDQGFDIAYFEETGQLRMPYFDQCMEVHNPDPTETGSFVAVSDCDASAVQTFEHSAQGQIIPQANTDLCLTLGDTTVPGGPRVVPKGLNFVFPPKNNDRLHVIRRLSFENCSANKAVLQQWEFRSGEYVPDTNAQLNRFR